MAGNTLDEAAMLRWPNRLAALLPQDVQWSPVIHVAEPASGLPTLYADAPGQCVTVVGPAPGAPAAPVDDRA